MYAVSNQDNSGLILGINNLREFLPDRYGEEFENIYQLLHVKLLHR